MFTHVRLLPSRSSEAQNSTSTTVVTRLESLPQAQSPKYSLWDSRVTTSSSQNEAILAALHERWESLRQQSSLKPNDVVFSIVDAGWWLSDEGASLKSRSMREGGNDPLAWYVCGTTDHSGLLVALVEWMQRTQRCEAISLSVSSLTNHASLHDGGMVLDDLLYPLTTVEQLQVGKLQTRVITNGIALARFLTDTVFPSMPIMKIRPSNTVIGSEVQSPATFCFELSTMTATSGLPKISVRVLITAERHFKAVAERLTTVLQCTPVATTTDHQSQTTSAVTDLPLSARVSSWTEVIGFREHIGLVLRVPERQVSDTIAILPFAESLLPADNELQSTSLTPPPANQSLLQTPPLEAQVPLTRSAPPRSHEADSKIEETLNRLTQQRDDYASVNKDLQNDIFRVLYATEGLVQNRAQLEQQLAAWQRNHNESVSQTRALETHRDQLVRRIDECQREDERLAVELRRHEALHVASCAQQRDEEKAIDLLKSRLRDVRETSQKDHANKLARLNAEHEERLEEMRRQANKKQADFDQQLVLVKENVQRSLTTSRNLQVEVDRAQQSLTLLQQKLRAADDEVIRLEREEQKREALLVKYRSTEVLIPDLELRAKNLRRQLEDAVDKRKQLSVMTATVDQEEDYLERERQFWSSRRQQLSRLGVSGARSRFLAEECCARQKIVADSASEISQIAREMFAMERIVDNRVTVAMRVAERRCIDSAQSLQQEEASLVREIEQLEMRAEGLAAQLAVAVEEQASVLQSARVECDAALGQLEETRRDTRQRLAAQEAEGERKKTTCRTLFNEFLIQIKDELDAGSEFLQRQKVSPPTDAPSKRSHTTGSEPMTDQQEADNMMRVVESYLQWSELMATCTRLEEEVVRTRQASSRVGFASKQVTELLATERQQLANLEKDVGRSERLKREALDATREFVFAATEQRQGMHDAVAAVLEKGNESLMDLKAKSAAAQTRVTNLERSMDEERRRAASVARNLSMVQEDQRLLQNYQTEYDDLVADNIRLDLQLETLRRKKEKPSLVPLQGDVDYSRNSGNKGTAVALPPAFSPIVMKTPIRTTLEIPLNNTKDVPTGGTVLPTPHFSAAASLNNSTRDGWRMTLGDQDDIASIPSPSRLFSTLDKPFDPMSNVLQMPPLLPSGKLSS